MWDSTMTPLLWLAAIAIQVLSVFLIWHYFEDRRRTKELTKRYYEQLAKGELDDLDKIA